MVWVFWHLFWVLNFGVLIVVVSFGGFGVLGECCFGCFVLFDLVLVLGVSLLVGGVCLRWFFLFALVSCACVSSGFGVFFYLFAVRFGLVVDCGF